MTSACRVHLPIAMVLVELVVELLESLVVAMVAVQGDVVHLRHVERLERTGHEGHELAEDTDAAVPEGGLGEAASQAPRASAGVVHLHHVRQLERVVVATGHKEAASQNRHAAPHVYLRRKILVEFCSSLKAVK